ncbi:MAG: bis(5'-nucleosyl)-tetraphosphatase [Bacteriovoracaceae bacterium]
MKLSCGVVPVRKKNNHWEFLILRCYKNWDFPKGMKDPGEEPLETAIREFQEETGLTKVDIVSKELYIETEPYSQGKIARYYLGKVTDDQEIVLLPNPVTGILEHHEYRWMKARDAEELLVPRLKRVLHWAEKYLAI